MNNAGTEGWPGPITDQTAESYAATFDTNVLGVILSVRPGGDRFVESVTEDRLDRLETA